MLLHKLLSPLLFFVGIFSMYGCKTEVIHPEQQPITVPPIAITADFTMDKTVAEPFDTITFSANVRNGARLEWDLGNGTFSSDSVVKARYYSIGDYQVQLTVFDSLNRTIEVTRKISVGERFIGGFTLTRISYTDSLGQAWDSDGSGPDVVVLFNPISRPVNYYVGESVGNNITPASLPFSKFYTNNSNYGFFRKETYIISLEEVSYPAQKRTMAKWTIDPYALGQHNGQGKGSFTLRSGQNELTMHFDLK